MLMGLMDFFLNNRACGGYGPAPGSHNKKGHVPYLHVHGALDKYHWVTACFIFVCQLDASWDLWGAKCNCYYSKYHNATHMWFSEESSVECPSRKLNSYLWKKRYWKVLLVKIENEKMIKNVYEIMCHSYLTCHFCSSLSLGVYIYI